VLRQSRPCTTMALAITPSICTSINSTHMPVAEQIFICGGGGLFCDNYVTGGGTLIAQDKFHDALRVDTATLTGFAPGQPFSITEVFDFTQEARDFSVRAAG
jgi:hypothetical protein